MPRKIVRYGKQQNKDKYNDDIYTHYTKICEYCGREFVSRRRDARFCHSLCQRHSAMERYAQENNKLIKEEEVNTLKQKRLKYANEKFTQMYEQPMPTKYQQILARYNKIDLWNYVLSNMVECDIVKDIFITLSVEDTTMRNDDILASLLVPNYNPKRQINIIWLDFLEK